MTTICVAMLAFTLGSAARSDDAKSTQPLAADQLFGEAKALSTREQWHDAAARFREFLQKHAADERAPEARFWLGFCLVKSEDFDDAVRELEPFQQEMAQNKWADDALLHLGHAYRGRDDNDQALLAWKRLLEKYPDSVWKSDAASQIVDVLFNATKDYAACLPYCERVVHEPGDHAGGSDARYAGAYCLSALGRYDEAERWMDQWFIRDDAAQAGWRRVLTAQRDLRQGRAEQAFRSLESLNTDFPDLGRADRLDLTLRAAAMLNREQHAARARDLLLSAIKQSEGDSQDDVNGLLDQLNETAGGEGAFTEILDKLAKEPVLPLLTRLSIQQRRVQALRDEERPEQAETLLREALAKDPGEYSQFRAAKLLAELLDEDREDQAGATKVLEEVLPRLHRADLIHQVRETLKELKSSTKEDRD